MDTRPLAARLGAAACLLLLALAVLPYAVVDAAEVGVYYGAGPVGPPFLSLLAAVALVALLAGAAGRSDPATVAGVALVLSGVAAGLAVPWALSARAVVGGTTAPAVFEYHPYAVVAAGLLAFAFAAWHARLTLVAPSPADAP